MVCDGAVAAAIMSNGDIDNNKAPHTNRMVTFKYRNHLYKISLQRTSESRGIPVPFSYYVWMWRSILQLMGEDTSVTVQERVSQALRMDMEGHMKVKISSNFCHLEFFLSVVYVWPTALMVVFLSFSQGNILVYCLLR